jgi:hypothetical protein
MICETCGAFFVPDKRKSIALRKKYKHCSIECRHNHSVARRIWSKIAVGEVAECWPWLAYKNADGYGVVGIKDQTVTVTRWLLEQRNGDPLADGECALHRCDNPACCNPTHLFVGTRGDNNRDRRAKGGYSRTFPSRGAAA